MEILAFIIIVLAVIGMQSLIFGKLAFKNLIYKCEFSVKEAHEGDEIFLVETVENRKVLPVPWLKANIYTSRWLDFAGARSVVNQESRYATSSFVLKSYQKIIRRWKVKCLKRGIYNIDTSTLVSGDLLSFRTNSMPVKVGATLKVYPAVVDFEQYFIPINYLQGERIVRRWIIDDPFIVSGAREYTPRDPMNRIHWRATAKEGRLMVRNNDYTSRLSLTVMLNIQSIENEYYNTIDKELVEYGIKVAASIFDSSLMSGAPVRFATNGTTIDDDGKMVFTEEAAGREHVSMLMEILAKLELKRVKDFQDFLSWMEGKIRNCDVIIITCYLTDAICEHVRELERLENRISILLLKEPEGAKVPEDMNIYVLSTDSEKDYAVQA